MVAYDARGTGRGDGRPARAEGSGHQTARGACGTGEVRGQDTDIERGLFDSAVALIQQRYPIGWGGAAAVRLENGDILTSVAPDTDLDALSVCMELGAFLEAHKRNLRVTHSLCITRHDENSHYKFLSPCGICQERLRFWGPDVLVAITNEANALCFRPLSEFQKHHWTKAFD
ncbi:cytidine deaminase [Yoonia sp.]|uniref:cytidine deaminase n=1 Tax=Yoonia sp. TaxID=2212373 RepID=UPI003A4D9E08